MRKFSFGHMVLGMAIAAILLGSIGSLLIAAPVTESASVTAAPVIKCGFLRITNVTYNNGTATIPINGTSTVYTDVFQLPSTSNYFTHGFKAASSGTVNLTITLEQGIYNVSTPGSADAAWALVSGVNATLTGTTQYRAAISPLGTPYGRYKIVGLTGNDASTTLTGDITSY